MSRRNIVRATNKDFIRRADLTLRVRIKFNTLRCNQTGFSHSCIAKKNAPSRYGTRVVLVVALCYIAFQEFTIICRPTRSACRSPSFLLILPTFLLSDPLFSDPPNFLSFWTSDPANPLSSGGGLPPPPPGFPVYGRTSLGTSFLICLIFLD